MTILMCAVAARWCDDRRVLPRSMEDYGVELDEEQMWSSAGWDYYAQVHQRYRRDIIKATTVYDLQIMAVSFGFPRGFDGG